MLLVNAFRMEHPENREPLKATPKEYRVYRDVGARALLNSLPPTVSFAGI